MHNGSHMLLVSHRHLPIKSRSGLLAAFLLLGSNGSDPRARVPTFSAFSGV